MGQHGIQDLLGMPSGLYIGPCLLHDTVPAYDEGGTDVADDLLPIEFLGTEGTDLLG